jgi:hypothetical protein
MPYMRFQRTAYGPAVASAAPQGNEEAYALTPKVTEQSRKPLMQVYHIALWRSQRLGLWL